MFAHDMDVRADKVIAHTNPSHIKLTAHSLVGLAAISTMLRLPFIPRPFHSHMGGVISDIRNKRIYYRQLQMEFGELIDPNLPMDVGLEIPKTTSTHIVLFSVALISLHSTIQTEVGILCMTRWMFTLPRSYMLAMMNKRQGFYEKVSRYDTPADEAPVLDNPLPALIPDEPDSYCAITSSVRGNGLYVGAMRICEWLVTARHAILGDRALSRYASVLYVKKGNSMPVRIHVIDSVIMPESEKITADLDAFGCSGHDLFALKVAHADVIFSQLQIRSQKLFYPLATGTIMIKPHVSHGTLFEVPEDRTTNTIHHTASSYAGMSGSPLCCRHRGCSLYAGFIWARGLRKRVIAMLQPIIVLFNDFATKSALQPCFLTARPTTC